MGLLVVVGDRDQGKACEGDNGEEAVDRPCDAVAASDKEDDEALCRMDDFGGA